MYKKKVGVMLIPGIELMKGNHNNANTKLRSLVKKEIGEDSFDQLSWNFALWNDVIYDLKHSYGEKVSSNPNLKLITMRKSMLKTLSDIPLCQPTFYNHNTTYSYIFDMLQNTLDTIESEIGPNGPIILVSHSLGSVIMYNFIKHKQSLANESTSPLQSMNTIASIYTNGSPLAVYFLALPPNEIPIKNPSLGIDKRICDALAHNSVGKLWINNIGTHDIFSYPIQAVNDVCDKMVHDEIIKVGPTFIKNSILSHLFYSSGSSPLYRQISTTLHKLLFAINNL